MEAERQANADLAALAPKLERSKSDIREIDAIIAMLRAEISVQQARGRAEVAVVR
jgi:cbb3-type cytochrome oxidase cytochrome c subunit